MPKYRVWYEVAETGSLVVSAIDEEAAIDAAEDELSLEPGEVTVFEIEEIMEGENN